MSQSAKFQEEICNQWLECENDEIDYYKKQFGENPTSFKTFAWGYTRAAENILDEMKKLVCEAQSLCMEDGFSFDEVSYDMLSKIDERLKCIGD